MMWLGFESVSIAGNGLLARRVEVGSAPRARWIVAGMLAFIGVLVGLRLSNPTKVFAELQRRSERHPIVATGLFRNSPPHLPSGWGGVAVPASLSGVMAEMDRRVDDVAIVGRPEQTPDIVLLLIESLRHDALTPRSAPNLLRFAHASLVSDLHYSAGNSSDVGACGLLFGVDAAFASGTAFGWEPLVPRLMQQAGYYRAFLGMNRFEWAGMDRYFNDRYFDFFQLGDSTFYYERDEEAIRQARQMLDREGRFADLKGRPVFVMLYLMTPHYDYHYAPQDEVFTPSLSGEIPSTPWSMDTVERIRNRYMNSIRTLDRIVEPLLDRDRVVIITGDHGESFLDDGIVMHGTRLSAAQMRTPLIFHMPGAPPARLPGPTSHADILPTILKALGVTVNDPAVMAGQSLLGPFVPEKRLPIVIRHFRSNNFAMYGTYTLRHPQRHLLRMEMDLDGCRFALQGALDEQGSAVPIHPDLLDELKTDLDALLNRLAMRTTGT
jgi:hypothetical protein